MDKDIFQIRNNDLTHGRGYVYSLQYHLVWCTKYRRSVLTDGIDEDCKNILLEIAKEYKFTILAMEVMPDHIHLLVSIPPKYSVSQFMGYLKGKSALMIFDKHANLKYKYGNRHFWAEGYYVSTVGLNEATIRKYIQEQEAHDIAMDKLSVKEYEDPFRGQNK